MVDLLPREVGKTYREAEAECSGMAAILDFYSEEIKRVYGTTVADHISRPGEAFHVLRKYPVGVTVGHLSLSFPVQDAAFKLGRSLASG